MMHVPNVVHPMSQMSASSPSRRRALPRCCVLSILFWCAACSTANSAPADVVAADAVAHVAEPRLAASAASQGVDTARDPELQELVRAMWSEPDFQRALQRSYLRGGDYFPPMTEREAVLRTEVLELIRDERLDDAASRLRGRQGDDSSPVFDYMLGNIYLSQQKWQEAAAEFVKATSKFDSYRRAWSNLGLALMRLERYREAAAAFAEVVKLGGNDPVTWGLLATMHARNGDFVAAEPGFRMVAMLEPDQPRWRIALASTLAGQGRHAESAGLLAALLRDTPDDAGLWTRQARAFLGMGESGKAAENLEIAAQLGGADFQSLNMLGAIYFNEGLYELAVDAYLRAIARDDRGSYQPLLEIANRLGAASAYEQSIRLAEAIEQRYGDELVATDRARLLKLRARLSGASGRSEEQVALLEQITTENPLDGDALLQLAIHYQQHGEPEKAVFRYEQAAQIEAFAARAKELHARLLVDRGQYQQALSLLQSVQQLDPRDDVRRLIEYVERAAARTRSSN